MADRQIYIMAALIFLPPVDLFNTASWFLRFEKLKTQLQKQHYNHHLPPNIIDLGYIKTSTISYYEPLDLDTLNTSLGKENHEMSPTPTNFSAHGYHSYRIFEPGDRIFTTKQQSISETSQSLIKSLCNMKGNMYDCYRHGLSVCRCKGQLADCSGKPYTPNIPYAPKLPPEIKCLLFRYNGASFLDESYFANVSDFRVIDFSLNSLRTISMKTFARFNGKLEYLMLNFNSLTYSNLKKVLNYPPSKRLDLVGSGLSTSIPKNFFRPFSNIRTSELYLDLNFLPRLDLVEFSVLKNLKYFSVQNCSIREFKSAVMPSLEFFNLKNNPISSFPESCVDTSTNQTFFSTNNHRSQDTISMFPKLKELNIGNTNIRMFPLHTELCFPKLELLYMYLNNISTFRSDSLKSLTSLRVLILDRMKSNISNIESKAFSSESLLSLHLSKNHIKFNSGNVSDQMFQDCSSLEVLHIDHNNFVNVTEKYYANLFTNLSRLTNVYMGSCNMALIPYKAFAQLPNVNRLYLYLNSISSIPTAAFDSMSSLQYLYLNENQISTVSRLAFSTETMQRLKEINLSKNNFQCNCDLLWFQSWLKHPGSTKFSDAPTGYKCANRPGIMLSDFILSKQACLLSHKTYILFTVVFSIFIISIIVFSILYRYRWHIRLTLYEWRSAEPKERRELTDITHDVFIVYCNDDSSWVINELLHRVENDWELGAFVHERDFVAGRLIIDNIVLAMNSCRHILVVLSSRFAYSNWCNFELQLCQSHVIEHALPSLLVVELEPVEQHQMSPIVAALRSSTTFLEWPETQRDEAIFWQKLEKCVRRMKRSNRK